MSTTDRHLNTIAGFVALSRAVLALPAIFCIGIVGPELTTKPEKNLLEDEHLKRTTIIRHIDRLENSVQAMRPYARPYHSYLLRLAKAAQIAEAKTTEPEVRASLDYRSNLGIKDPNRKEYLATLRKQIKPTYEDAHGIASNVLSYLVGTPSQSGSSSSRGYEALVGRLQSGPQLSYSDLPIIDLLYFEDLCAADERFLSPQTHKQREEFRQFCFIANALALAFKDEKLKENLKADEASFMQGVVESPLVPFQTFNQFCNSYRRGIFPTSLSHERLAPLMARYSNEKHHTVDAFRLSNEAVDSHLEDLDSGSAKIPQVELHSNKYSHLTVMSCLVLFCAATLACQALIIRLAGTSLKLCKRELEELRYIVKRYPFTSASLLNCLLCFSVLVLPLLVIMSSFQQTDSILPDVAITACIFLPVVSGVLLHKITAVDAVCWRRGRYIPWKLLEAFRRFSLR